MELEEMKGVWTEMSGQIEKQKKLTDKLIIMMTHEQYKYKLSKIRNPETIGALICFVGAFLILINLDKLETTYLITCGIISIGYLLIVPGISLWSIYKMNDLDIKGQNYKQILTEYARGKNRFLFVQKLSFFLTFILLIAMLPVMVKIIGGKTAHVKPEVWFWFIPFALLVFFPMAKWVYGCYVRTTVQMENLLKDLEE